MSGEANVSHQAARRIVSGFVILFILSSTSFALTPSVGIAYAAGVPAGSTAEVNTPAASTAQDTEPPSSPEALTVAAYPGYILVDWYAANDDTGVSGYLILRNGQPLAIVNSGTLS